jgi:hypothetical protein
MSPLKHSRFFSHQNDKANFSSQKGLLENHSVNEIEFIDAVKNTKLIEAIEPGVLESRVPVKLWRGLSLTDSLVELIPHSDVF